MTKKETFNEEEVKLMEKLALGSEKVTVMVKKFLVEYPERNPGPVYTKLRKIINSMPPEMPGICVNCGKSFLTRGDLRCDPCQARGVNWND